MYVIYDETGLPVEITDVEVEVPEGFTIKKVTKSEAERIAPKVQWEQFLVSPNKTKVKVGEEVKILIWYNRAMKLKRNVAKIEIVHGNNVVSEEIQLKEHRGVKHVVYTYYTFIVKEAGNYKITVSLDNGLSEVVEIEAS